MNRTVPPSNAQALRDLLARALHSEYCDADVNYSWHDLPGKAKDQWRRVAAYVERLAAPDEDAEAAR